MPFNKYQIYIFTCIDTVDGFSFQRGWSTGIPLHVTVLPPWSCLIVSKCYFFIIFFGILVISNDLLLQSHGTLCLPFICQSNFFLPAGFILSDYLADTPRKCFELSRKACTKSEQVPVHLFKGCLLERCCSLPTKHAVIACIAVETTSWKQKLFKKNHLLTIFQFPKNTCVYTHMSRTWSVASKWYNVIELMGRTCTSVSIRVSCNVLFRVAAEYAFLNG